VDNCKLIVMVGLPYSGKSTYASKSGFPIVSPDAIRLALHGQRFIDKAEPMVWAIAGYMVEALFLAGHDNVILDATNTTKKRRDVWSCNREWETQFVHINTSKEECIIRAKKNGDEEIIPVIERMSEQFEDPSYDSY